MQRERFCDCMALGYCLSYGRGTHFHSIFFGQKVAVVTFEDSEKNTSLRPVYCSHWVRTFLPTLSNELIKQTKLALSILHQVPAILLLLH